ncbi:MAG: YgiQ family radical SAM protein [Planctomycetes bacterium]|nr:YgiQ family radical SAM protein [Planctomycetota bacterium]
MPRPLPHARNAPQPLPMTPDEVRARGWDEVDVVLVSGDAYVDHPSFGTAVIGRVLEAAGFRVAILAQPDWRTCEPWRLFGRPRLFFGVGAGNMDSMINHYTANRKVRNDDAYSPGGRIGLRPDRATLAYCQRSREAWKGVPVIAGAVEASLRRLAHYDYWSDTVRGSILLDAKADAIVYGMGEATIVEVARRLAAGKTLRDCRDLRGLVYALGAKEPRPEGEAVERLPSFEEVKKDPVAFAKATRQIHHNSNPFNAKTLVQAHGERAVVQTPPQLPLDQVELDRIHELPYTRRPHPAYREKVPAFEVIKHSVQIMRGCFGGCTFCSITTHQGRIIQSRSKASILRELEGFNADPEFKGVVSDLGGPTANMYEMRCTKPEVEKTCRRLSCVHPKICKLLGTDHGPVIDLMRRSRRVEGVRKVFVASGIRMDLAARSPDYVAEVAKHHTGGRLKVAPEHASDRVLDLMKKPSAGEFERFTEEFHRASQEVGKRQELVPYFIASHPGSDLDAMIELAVFLKRTGYRPDQVQDFIPSPMDVATAMYHTGLDPISMKPVPVAKGMRDRRLQRALMQFFKPANWFLVREALQKAGRTDLIGAHCDALIPPTPPREALEARRAQAQRALGRDKNDEDDDDGDDEHVDPEAPRVRPPVDGTIHVPPPVGRAGHRRDDRRQRGDVKGYRPGRREGR